MPFSLGNLAEVENVLKDYNLVMNAPIMANRRGLILKASRKQDASCNLPAMVVSVVPAGSMYSSTLPADSPMVTVLSPQAVKVTVVAMADDGMVRIDHRMYTESYIGGMVRDKQQGGHGCKNVVPILATGASGVQWHGRSGHLWDQRQALRHEGLTRGSV